MGHLEPKKWADMTDAERGALLLADHNGSDIVAFIHGDVWEKKDNGFDYFDHRAYRVKPTPTVTTEVVTSFLEHTATFGWSTSSNATGDAAYLIETTFILHDGVPVSGTVKVAS